MSNPHPPPAPDTRECRRCGKFLKLHDITDLRVCKRVLDDGEREQRELALLEAEKETLRRSLAK